MYDEEEPTCAGAIDSCPAECYAPVQRHKKRSRGLERENQAQAMFWVLLVLKLSRRPEKASVAATHLAQQVQDPGTKRVILGLEVAPKGAHQIPHDLLHCWLQELWVETAHMTSKSTLV